MNNHQPWIKPVNPSQKTWFQSRPSRRAITVLVVVLAVILGVVIFAIVETQRENAAIDRAAAAPPAAAEKQCGVQLVPGSDIGNPGADFMSSGQRVPVQVWTTTDGRYVAYTPLPGVKYTWCPGDLAKTVGLPFWRAWDGVRPSWCDITTEPMGDGVRQCEAAINP